MLLVDDPTHIYRGCHKINRGCLKNDRVNSRECRKNDGGCLRIDRRGFYENDGANRKGFENLR